MKKPPLLSEADESIPSLNYAITVQKLAASVGFDWPDISGVIDKIHEELNEVQYEIDNGKITERLHDEMGDLLFACINLARHLNIDPESALNSTNNKFKRRFEFIENQVLAQDKTLAGCTLDELDVLWDKAKLLETK
mgnify:CR=1 FL=1